MWLFVPDTSALLDNVDFSTYVAAASTEFGSRHGQPEIHLCMTVVEELERMATDRSQEKRNSAARATRVLDAALCNQRPVIHGAAIFTSAKTYAPDPDVFGSAPSADSKIVQFAYEMAQKYRRHAVVLVTGDRNMKIKARAMGVQILATPLSLAGRRARLEMSAEDDLRGNATAVVVNRGPYRATKIAGKVRSGATRSVGPFDLAPGSSQTIQVPWHAPGQTIIASLTWTDGSGTHTEEFEAECLRPPSTSTVRRYRYR